jgi:hypothetical protein
MLHTKVVVHGVPEFERPTVLARKDAARPAQARQPAKRRPTAPGQPVAAWQWGFFK